MRLSARLAALGAACLLTSCALGAGAGAGLSVDTDGGIGAFVGLRGHFGVSLSRRTALTESLGLEGGACPELDGACLVSSVGLDVVHLPTRGPLAWRLGARGRFAASFRDDDPGSLGPGLALALLSREGGPGRLPAHLGVELAGYALYDYDDHALRRGLLTLGVVYERHWLGQPRAFLLF